MKLATVAFKQSFSFWVFISNLRGAQEPRPQLALLPSPHHWTKCWVLPVPWHLLSLWDWSFMYPWNAIGGLIGSKKASWDHLPLRECYFLGGEANSNNQPHPSGRTNHPWGGRNHARPLQRGFHWQKLRQRLVCRQVDGLQLHVWHFLTAWHPGHAKGVGLKK